MKKIGKIFYERNTKGITLIALVITIIVLLILAGVTVAQITGQDGAPNKAAQARLENRRGEAKEAASVIVTGLVQEYHEKKFVEGTTNATSAGEYVLEVLEEEDKTDGNYVVSVESDILQVEDEEDVLATGIVQDDGVIVWDGTPRAVTASVNPWNNMATEEDVAPADLFYYDIMEEPQVASKVDGVEEKAKVADNSGNIKIADAETENLGKAKITGINVEKLAESYSSDDYTKRYEAKDYNGDWQEFFDKHYEAGVVGDYSDDRSGTYYYYVSGSGNIEISANNSNVEYDDDGRYRLRYDYFWSEMNYSNHDMDGFINHEYNSNSNYYISYYADDVANMIYDSYYSWDDGQVYFYYYGRNDGQEHEIYRCNSDEYWNNRNDIEYAITNYIVEHSEDFKYELVEAKYSNNSENYLYNLYYGEGEDKRYFETNYFSPYFISEYDTTPSYFNKFVFPHIYEEDGKKYEITSIDLTGYDSPNLLFPYAGDKIKKVYIPNSVTSVSFGEYGNSDYFTSPSFDTILVPGGLSKINQGMYYFNWGYNVKKVVFGEGITEVNTNNLPAGVTDIYLPKSLTKIDGNLTSNWDYWQNIINVHYAGKKGAWSRVEGNKPNDDKVTFRSRYSD